VQEGGNPDTMTGQPQGIAPTIFDGIVGAIPCGCPFSGGLDISALLH